MLGSRVRHRTEAAGTFCPSATTSCTHLTMWLLSESICRSEISRSVVDGTPSSSICTDRQFRQHGAARVRSTEMNAAAKVLQPCTNHERPCGPAPVPTHHLATGNPPTYLQPRLLQRHQPACVLVPRLVHLAVGALAHLLYFLVVLLQEGESRHHSRLAAAAAAIRSCWAAADGRPRGQLRPPPRCARPAG